MKFNPTRAALLLSLLLVVHLTLFPFHFISRPRLPLAWSSPDTPGDWLDVVMNLYFYLPLGLFGALSFPGWRGFLLTLTGASLLSTGLEYLQAFEPMRVSSARDVLLNSMGAALGALLARTKLVSWLSKRFRGLSWTEDRSAILVVFLWAIARWAPFVPSFRRSSLYSIHSEPVDSPEAIIQILGLAFAGFAIATLLKETFALRVATIAGILLLAALPLQLLLIGRPMGAEKTIASAVGLILGLILPVAGNLVLARSLALATLLILALRQTMPFEWSDRAAHSFSWMPLSAALGLARPDGLSIIADKLFFAIYGIRQFQIAFALPLGIATLLITALVFAGEISQIYQPGRIPDITDILLCLVGALLLRWAQSEQPLKA